MLRCPLASGKRSYRAKPPGERQATPPTLLDRIPTDEFGQSSREAGSAGRGARVSPGIGLPLAFFLLLGLALTPPDRRAENIAEAGARIGRAELGHRPLLFIDLARLDRHRHPPRGAVDRRDLGIDPFADGKAVGALLAAVARQLGFSDETGHAVGQRDLDPGFGDPRDRAGNDIALLHLGHALLERIGLELLDAERNALFLDIDIEHLDAHDLPLVVVAHGLLAGAGPVDIREMHHAVDIAGQADEQTELGDVAHLALDGAADRVLLEEGFPRVGHDLLQTEADAPLLRIDVEHHHLDLLAGRDDLAGVHILFGPAHLGDMDQPLDDRLQFDEGAVVGDVGDAALVLGARRIFELDALPRIGFELLHAERDALGLRVKADDLDLDGLADIERLGRVVDAPPGDVGDVQQAVDPAQIDEGTVIGDVLDDAGEDLALLEAGDQLGALLGAALLEDSPARHDDVAARAVHLEDLEGLRRTEERGDVAHRADIDLAARQKRHRAAEVDREAALDPAEDRAGHPLIRLEALFQEGPRLLAPRLLARQLCLAVLVFHALEEDLDDVADMNIRRGAGNGELLERDAPFRFEADINEGGIVLD